MNTPIRILYVDDSPLDRELVLDSLEKEHGGFQVTQAASRADFELALAEGSFDLILSDFNILGFEGLHVLETVHAKDPDLPVVIVTGTGSEEIAVEAMKRGAADYVIKTPKHIQRLPLTIHTALDQKHLKEDRDRLFNLSLDLLCVAGFDGTFKQLNPAWEKTLGWSKQELLARPYLDFVHPDDREATSQVAATLVDGQLVYHFENRYICKDGAYKWISWNSYPLIDEALIFAVARDITDRKQAEKALLESERRFRNLADNSPDVIYVLDLVEHRLLFFNHLEFCGYSRRELEASNSILAAVHPDDLSAVAAHWQALINDNGAEARVIEYRLKHKEGSWEWIQSRETILTRDQHGQPTQLLVTLTIITERKQVEEKIQLSEDRYRDLVENSQDLICTHDLEGIILSANPASARLLGYELNELIGKNLCDFMVPEVRRYFKYYIARLMQHGSASGLLSMQTKDGKRRIWEYQNSVRSEGVAKPVIRGMARDITERKQAEDEIKRLKEFNENLINNMSEGIVVQNVDGYFTFVNPAVTVITGYLPEELLGSHWSKFFHSDQREIIMDADHRRLAGEASQYEVAFLHKNRQWVHLLVSGSPLFRNGQFDGTMAVFTDITERKQAEEALRQAEKKYRTIFENAMEGIHQTTRDGKYISANPAAARMLGYGSPEELISSINDLNLQFYVEPGRREEFVRLMDLHGSVSDFESEVYRKDRSKVWVSENVHTVRDGHGALLYFEGTSEDITERKRAEDSLRESEERYHDIFNGVQEAIFVETLDGKILAVNEHACVMYGYSQDEFLARTVADLVPEDYPIFLATDSEHTLSSVPVETVNRRANGEAFPIEISGRLQTINGEKVLLVVARDITERKQAEEKIQQQIERLTALREIDQTITANFDLNHSLTTLISRTVTLLKVDAATVLLLQPETNTLGYGAGYGFRTMVPETASVKFGESYAGEAAMEKRLVQIPNLAKVPDNLFLTGFLKGEDFVSYYGAPLIVKGEVVGVLEVFNRSLIERDRDWLDFFITLAGQAAIAIANAQLFLKLRGELHERLRTEEEIRELNLKLEQRVAERTIDLERALKVKDEFLANMSHELRTPLNSILGLTESMQEGTAGAVNEKQFKYLNTIQESGRHLLNLINDILDLAKIEAGQVILDIAKADIQSICQASLRMIQQLAHKKNQDVSFVMDNEIGLIWADQRRLKQMIVNLLSNAVKFTPDGGRLGLEVTANRQEHTVSIAVWDHGIGISESNLSRLFQPFVQVDSALSRNSSGTGLGLALVAQMARLHGGQVRAKSTPGQGSRFTIVLPWNPADRTGSLIPAKPAASSSNIPTHGIPPSHTILLAEDTASAAMMVEDYLTAAGFNVIVAGNGFEAISQAETIQPDLILMDVMMPNIDGFEATRIIRKNPALRKTPILGLTALAMSGDRERCLEAGMNDHITKPVNLMDLLRTIRGYLPSDA